MNYVLKDSSDVAIAFSLANKELCFSRSKSSATKSSGLNLAGASLRRVWAVKMAPPRVWMVSASNRKMLAFLLFSLISHDTAHFRRRENGKNTLLQRSRKGNSEVSADSQSRIVGATSEIL